VDVMVPLVVMVMETAVVVMVLVELITVAIFPVAPQQRFIAYL